MKSTIAKYAITGATFLLVIPQVFAQTPSVTVTQAVVSVTPVTTGTTTTGARAAARQQAQQDRMTNLKARANQEVDRRIASLNKLIARITSVKRLTADQKTTFTGQIQTEVTNLTTLKAKIDADADLVTLKTDVQSIILSYRVYALFMPKIHLLAAADSMIEVTDRITELSTKIQQKIQEAQTGGNDVTAIQISFTDMQAKVADAKKQAQNVIDTVIPLTPDGYPDNKTTLTNARTLLQVGRSDLTAVRQDIEAIRQGFKSFRARIPQASGSGQTTSSSTNPNTTAPAQ